MSSSSSKSCDSESYSLSSETEIDLDLQGANVILGRHLQTSCLSLQRLKRGCTNRTFLATSTDNSSFIIRLSGIISWSKVKTEGEVAGMIYLKLKCPLIPVPKVYGYCSDKLKSGVNSEYILMEHLPGVPLDDVFKSMTFHQQAEILDQIIDILEAMQSIKFDKIGSFIFALRISEKSGLDLEVFQNILIEDIEIGPVLGHGVGPFETWWDYFQTICRSELNEMINCKFMEPQLKNTKRIEMFLENCNFPNTVLHPAFVFTHGDFDARNLLVNGTTISGLFDFEFCGAFPVDNEWFDGFYEFGANTSESSVFKKIIPKEAEDTEDTEEITKMRDYFNEKCKQRNISIPSEVLGHSERSELYYFWCNICLWYIRDIRENSLIGNTPKSWFLT